MHKSIQDYFAAEYITASVNKKLILQKLYDTSSEKFNNVLRLFYDMDRKSFLNVLVKKMLIDFVYYFENSYQSLSFIPTVDLENRKALTFKKNVFIYDSGKLDLIGGMVEEIIRDGLANDWGSWFGVSVHSGMLLYQTNSFIDNIIYILYEAKSEFIKEVLINPNFTNVIKVDFGGLSYIELDDSPNSPLNSSENFSKINNELYANFSYRGEILTLDYRKCLDYLLKNKENREDENDLAGL